MLRTFGFRPETLLAALTLCACVSSGGRPKLDAAQAPDDAGQDGGRIDADDAGDAGGGDAQVDGAVSLGDGAAERGACATDNGGCDALTECSVSGEQVSCGVCPTGYAGTGKRGCVDIDECADSPCSDLAGCTNEPGSYACGSCPDGYDDVNGDASDCRDIDECATDNGGCDALTTCTNTDGSRECGVCPASFADADEGDATNCVWDDPALLDLAPSEGALVPAFSPTLTAYTIELPLSVESLSLVAVLPSAEVSHANARIVDEELVSGTASAPIALKRGPNVFDVIVTADSGTTRTYRVTAVRTRRFDAYVKASVTSSGLGASIALSRDGSTLVVGAPDEDSGAGAIYVYTWTPDGWSEQVRWVPSFPDAGDRFGASVALSGNGDTLAVGASGHASSSRVISLAAVSQQDNGAPSAGAVFVYKRTASVWSTQAFVKAPNADSGDYFGTSVALSESGDTLAVGAIGEQGAGYGVDPADNNAGPLFPPGAAYAFIRTGKTWASQAYLKGDSIRATSFLGYSVSLSDDGNRLAVGAPGITVMGAALMFDRTSSIWSGPVLIDGYQSTRSDYGWDVSVSGDGNTVAVGSPLDGDPTRGVFDGPPGFVEAAGKDSGAVFVYGRAGLDWSLRHFIKSTNSDKGDTFGQDVALSANGKTLAVGAPAEGGAALGVNAIPVVDDNGLLNSGAAYVFTDDGSGFVETEYVKAINAGASDAFGECVALSASGNVLAVGAPGEDAAAVGVSNRPPALNNNSATDTGAAYVYH